MLKPPTEKISAETREKLLALAEFIETDRTYRFDMESFFDNGIDGMTAPCGTACCIGGHAILLLGDKRVRDVFEAPRVAAELLGLSEEQASQLFEPWRHSGPENPDRAHAARTIRNCAYTGDVDWSV